MRGTSAFGGRYLEDIDLGQSPHATALIPGGKTLVVGSTGGHVVLVDVAKGEETARFLAHREAVICVAVSADGKTLATASGKVIKVWDLNTRKQLVVLRGDEETAAVAVAPDGKTVASMHGRRGQRAMIDLEYSLPEVRVWEVATGKERAQLLPPKMVSEEFAVDNPIPAGWGRLTLSLNGKFIAARWPTMNVTVWDADTGQDLKWLVGSSAGIAFSPDSKLFALNDKGIRLVDTANGKGNKEGFKTKGEVLAFSPDGKVLVVSQGSELEFLAVDSGNSLAKIKGDPESDATVLFCPDGKTLAALVTTKGETQVKVWELTWEKTPGK